MAKGRKIPTENPGPPSWGLGVGLATPPHKTLHATEMPMNLPTTYPISGEESPPTRRSVMMQCDQSQKEVIKKHMAKVSGQQSKESWQVLTSDQKVGNE